MVLARSNWGGSGKADMDSAIDNGDGDNGDEA
jgi:hypothetical protein